MECDAKQHRTVASATSGIALAYRSGLLSRVPPEVLDQVVEGLDQIIGVDLAASTTAVSGGFAEHISIRARSCAEQ